MSGFDAAASTPVASGPAAARPLDIVVPVYRNAGLTSACLASLLAHRSEVARHAPRLVLVNDSPDDAEVEALLGDVERRHADVVVLRNERNVGFVHSVNRGLALALARGAHALLVNSDTVTLAGTLGELLRCTAADPSIGFVCPRSNRASICSLPHTLDASDPAAAERAWRRLSRSLPVFHFAPTAVGFYCLVSHTVLADVSHLHDMFGVGYEEENDLVMRAGALGLRAVIANHAFAFHHGSASFDLTGLDVASHRHGNLQRLVSLHPEFPVLMARYERSPHLRAERLLSGMLDDGQGRLKVVFDLTGLQAHEHELGAEVAAAIETLARRHGDALRVTAVCTARQFRDCRLAAAAGVQHEEPGASGLHAIAIRCGGRLEADDLPRLAALAPIGVLMVAGTTGEDCSPFAGRLDLAWEPAAATAHALLFTDAAVRDAFRLRHPGARDVPEWPAPFPLRLTDHGRRSDTDAASTTVLIWAHGQAQPDDGSEAARARLAALHPTLRFVVSTPDAQPSSPTSGPTDARDALLAAARLVVVPGREGSFDNGLLRALAAGRSVVARDTRRHRAAVAAFTRVSGIHWFTTDDELPAAFRDALADAGSAVDDTGTADRAAWADAFAATCQAQVARDDVFERLRNRLAQQDGRGVGAPAAEASGGIGDVVERRDAEAAGTADLGALLAMSDSDFVRSAYATTLGRPADEAGQTFYVGQLRDGVDRLDILQSLLTSPEGRAREARLAGLEERRAARERPLARVLRRLFGR